MKTETEIEKIKERNMRVEADKAWETSLFRKVLITVFTYHHCNRILSDWG